MLNPDEYLLSPPAWAQDGAVDQYRAALKDLGLELGRNPSAKCPGGDHDESTDSNVCAYENGVMCYSRHGYLSRRDVIAAAGRTPSRDQWSLSELAKREVDRFVAEDQLRALLAAGVEQRLQWDESKTNVGVDCLFRWARRDRETDQFWNDRLQKVLGDSYPREAYEFWAGDGIHHRSYRAESRLGQLGKGGHPSYTVSLLEPREKPDKPLALRLAPKLAAITGQNKVVASAGIDRFLSGERTAVAKSSLIAIECVDRPVPHLPGGWQLPRKRDELPTFTAVAQLTRSRSQKPDVLDEFFNDLRYAIAFEDDEAFVRYVAYLVQPMLVPLQAGQFPAYSLTGATNSGKTFLAAALPNELYRNNASDPVFVSRMPDSEYEMGVQLDAHRGALYCVFDEAIDMNAKQTKTLDQLITAPVLQARRMKVGYCSQPNHLTFGITAVAKSLPPETAGRMLEIHLTESRSEAISQFYNRWKGRGAEILPALYDAIAGVSDVTKCDPVPHRRPGFAILRRVLGEAFALKADFAVTANEDEMLDLICQACDAGCGTKRDGGWRRIGFRKFSSYYTEVTGIRVTSRTTEQRINTALGHKSTRQHPSYRDGYRWEDGRRFEIEIREESEGQGNTRKSVYVRELKSSPPASDAPSPSPPTTPKPDEDGPGSTTMPPAVCDGVESVAFDLDELDRQLFPEGDTDA